MSTAIYAPSSTPRLRITRRGRAVLTFAVALPLAAGMGLAMLNGGGATATSSTADVAFSYVTVAPGESLWQIAEAVAPEADPREVIADIQNLNHVSASTLQAGDRLAIPTQYAG